MENILFCVYAEFIHADALVVRLSFLDRDDETSAHYFIMNRTWGPIDSLCRFSSLIARVKRLCMVIGEPFFSTRSWRMPASGYGLVRPRV
jgi:hypothetical protein